MPTRSSRETKHLHVNEAVRDGSRSLSLALCADDRVIGGFVLKPEDEAGVRELGFWLARPYWGQGIMRRAASHMIQEVNGGSMLASHPSFSERVEALSE